jgi:hypothetical protein
VELSISIWRQNTTEECEGVVSDGDKRAKVELLYL